MDVVIARAEALALMAAVEPEPAHVRQVARLAGRLFDDLAVGDEEDRCLLEAAGWLHDIGCSVARDGKGHHKESARLIREAVWTGFRADEVAVLAQIARYHRKSPPTAEHADFMALPVEDRQRVERLAALLRVADGLDRQHLQKVVAVRAERTDAAVVATVFGEGLAEELAAAANKADLAERVFARPWRFRAA